LTPTQFREQLVRNFNLHLTPGEVAALIRVFDENGDGCIDCSEFIRSFFRIAFDERNRMLRSHLTTTEKLNTIKRIETIDRMKLFESRVLRKIKPASAADRESMLRKIQTVSADYERREHWGDALLAFESATLTPTAFTEVLRQAFLINLSPGEICAAQEAFLHSSGGIDCGLFLSHFFHVGKTEKETRMMKSLQVKHRLHNVKKRFEDSLVSNLEIQKVTSVQYPLLPDLSDNTFAGRKVSKQNPAALCIGESGFSDSMDLNGSVSDRPSTAPIRSRFARKMSVQDAIDPNRAALSMFKSQSSMVHLYPSASTETKLFLVDIEKEEAMAKKMSRRRPRDGYGKVIPDPKYMVFRDAAAIPPLIPSPTPPPPILGVFDSSPRDGDGPATLCGDDDEPF
jgi:hypothetical protein